MQLSGFHNIYDDLIIQKRLSASEDTLRRRMRVNLSEATISGLELEFAYYGFKNVSINGHLTYLNAKGKQEGKDLPHLDNKPEILSGIFVNYNFPYNFSIQLESELIGTQYETDPFQTDKYIKIDGALKFNGRISYNLPVISNIFSEVFIRVNNIFDKYHLNQLGLPENGRIIHFGINAHI